MIDAAAEGPVWVQAPQAAPTPTLVRSGYPEWMASLLARRGIDSPEQAAAFLQPSADRFADPKRIKGLSRAVERLRLAVTAGQKTAIVGDYDVDGISATAILLAVFERCGIDCEAILPNRFETGYGFQPDHVEQAVDAKCELLVTADCGSTAFAALEAARSHGLDVIITDHHLGSGPLPEGVIEVNPRHLSEDDPCRNLSGAGVALKLAQALISELELSVSTESLLRIACLGTICDLVPLRGDNRIIASLGLAALPETRSRGLRALIDRAGLRPPYGAPDIGFRIGPRLNAAGRLADPRPALELLMTRDQAVANRTSARLEELNRQRQVEEMRVVEEAEARFTELSELPPILVAWDPKWHRGVVGIAAGRLARRFHRPAVLLSVEGQVATGSGRSIDGIHLHRFIGRWEERLQRFGGHAQAIGLTVDEQDLERLRQEWIETARREWSSETLRARREYELDLEPARLNSDLLGELRRLEPFGMGNPQPIIRVGPLTVDRPVRVFGRGHVSAMAQGEDGASVALLGWGWQDRSAVLAGPFEVLGCLEFDRYRRRPTLRLVDARPWSGSQGST